MSGYFKLIIVTRRTILISTSDISLGCACLWPAHYLSSQCHCVGEKTWRAVSIEATKPQ